MKIISPSQIEALKSIAAKANEEIAAEENSQLIGVHVSVMDDEDDDGKEYQVAILDVNTYRTQSAQEETLAYNVVQRIGKMLSEAGIQDAIEMHIGDSIDGNIHSACYTIVAA